MSTDTASVSDKLCRGCSNEIQREKFSDVKRVLSRITLAVTKIKKNVVAPDLFHLTLLC